MLFLHCGGEATEPGLDGAIWISLESGLGRLRSGRIEAVAELPVSQWHISALGFGSGGQLWVGTGNAGVWEWQAGEARQLATLAQLTVGPINAITEDGSGTPNQRRFGHPEFAA